MNHLLISLPDRYISNLSNQTFSMNCSVVKNVFLKTPSSRVFFFNQRGTGISRFEQSSTRQFSSLTLKLCSLSLSVELLSLTIFPSTISLPLSVKSNAAFRNTGAVLLRTALQITLNTAKLIFYRVHQGLPAGFDYVC